jgi:thiol:disulfide interchange protein
MANGSLPSPGKLFVGMLVAAAILSSMRGTPRKALDGWGDGAAGHEAAMSESEESGVPVAVYFSAEWCGPCKTFRSDVLGSAEVQEHLEDYAKVLIDIDAPESQALVRQYGVRSIPAFFVHADSSARQERVSHGLRPDGFVKACERAARL